MSQFVLRHTFTIDNSRSDSTEWFLLLAFYTSTELPPNNNHPKCRQNVVFILNGLYSEEFLIHEKLVIVTILPSKYIKSVAGHDKTSANHFSTEFYLYFFLIHFTPVLLINNIINEMCI